MDDRLTLLSNLQKQLPKSDKHSWKFTLSKVDWEKVSFQNFTPKECQQEWELIQADVSRYGCSFVDRYTHFKMDDRLTLLSNLQKQLPKSDKHSWKFTLSKVDWEKVSFQNFTPKECQQEWELIQADVNTHFKMDDRLTLLSNLQKQLPKSDKHSWKFTLSKVDWEKVSFQNFTPKECQQEWELIQADVPRSQLRAKWKALSDKRRMKWIHMSLQKKDEYQVFKRIVW
ncbi:nucleolar transcription factor 1-like [Apostichopus japonicus]|uniref:nucleolar transcription factor 1-like n=1 Tax=Stichopus japonicus TaxID=307972 RepID=UPI003AB2E9CC